MTREQDDPPEIEEEEEFFERDQWGRPLIDGQTYMRTSKFSSLLSQPYLTSWHIEWGMRSALRYPGEAFDLAMRSAAGEKVGTQVQELAGRAGMNEKRDKGRDRHTLVRWMITGRELPEMPPAARRELTRVAEVVRGLGEISGVEVPLVCDEWRCAGSADYVGRTPEGMPFIADLKTGKRYSDSDYSWAVQLVVYARSVMWINRMRGDEVAPTLPRLYVIHAPQAEPGKVTVREIDAGAAKELAGRCWQIFCNIDGFRSLKPLLKEVRP